MKLSHILLPLAAGSLLIAAGDVSDANFALRKTGSDYAKAATDQLRRGSVERAIRLYQKDLEKKSRDGIRSANLSNLCAAYAMNGAIADAIAACNDALALDGENWRAYVNRGIAQSARGDLAAARADFSAAHRIAPDEKIVQTNIDLARAN